MEFTADKTDTAQATAPIAEFGRQRLRPDTAQFGRHIAALIDHFSRRAKRGEFDLGSPLDFATELHCAVTESATAFLVIVPEAH